MVVRFLIFNSVRCSHAGLVCSRTREKMSQAFSESWELNQNALMEKTTYWPAPGSEDTKFGVTMGPEVGHGEAEVYAGVQA